MNVGGKAKIKNREDLGVVTILEFSGQSVYVELKNGVEMDFNKELLIAPNAIDPKRIVSDDWFTKNIDPVVIGLAAVEYDRQQGNKNKPVEWKSLTNEMKMNHVAALFDKRMDGTRLYEAMSKGIVTKVRLATVIQAAAHTTNKELKTDQA